MCLFYSRLHKVWDDTFLKDRVAHFEPLHSRQAVKTQRKSDIMKISALSIPNLMYLCFREAVYRQTDCLGEFVSRRAGVIGVTCAWVLNCTVLSNHRAAHENTRGTDVHLQQVSVTEMWALLISSFLYFLPHSVLCNHHLYLRFNKTHLDVCFTGWCSHKCWCTSDFWLHGI